MPESLTKYDQHSVSGQNSERLAPSPPRINWNSISDQVMSVLNIEKGVFYTVKELLFRPGKAVRKHMFKNRRLLLNPVRFLVLSTTLATFITFYYMNESSFNTGFEQGFMNVETGNNTSNERVTKALIPMLIDLFKQFVNISYFFLVPAGALVSWLFLRKSYNVPELAVAHCYMWSMVNCFTIVFTPLMLVSDYAIIFLAVLGFFYPFFFYTKFFNQGAKGFLKGVIVNFLNYFLLMIFFAVFGYLYLRNIEEIIFPNSCSF
ncbi:MAG: DUF3667 domain-containing protein [Flavobacteriales bacterium]